MRSISFSLFFSLFLSLLPGWGAGEARAATTYTLQDLGPGQAAGVNGAGTLIVGQDSFGNAAVWTLSGGSWVKQLLAPAGSIASGVNAAGTVIVGADANTGNLAVWTLTGGSWVLQDLATMLMMQNPRVNAAGTVILGQDDGGLQQAAIWTLSGGSWVKQILPRLPGAVCCGDVASGANDTGTVVIGSIYGVGGTVWTLTGGSWVPQALPTYGNGGGSPNAVNGAGTLITSNGAEVWTLSGGSWVLPAYGFGCFAGNLSTEAIAASVASGAVVSTGYCGSPLEYAAWPLAMNEAGTVIVGSGYIFHQYVINNSVYTDTYFIGAAFWTLSGGSWGGLQELPGPVGTNNVAYAATGVNATGTVIVGQTPTGDVAVWTGTTDLPPVAVPGGPYAAVEHQSVTLNGTGSYDDNTSSAQLGYAWAVASKPSTSTGGTLTGANSATPTFTPDVPGTFGIQLTVTDSIGQTNSAIATVSSANLPPVAIVGAGQATYPGQAVAFNGSSSYDPDGDSITWAWTLSAPTGSTATLTGAATSLASLTPDIVGTYVVTLIVTDFWGLASPPAQATVSVVSASQYAQSTIATAINQIAALPSSAVTTSGNQLALQNLLHQAIAALQSGNTALAIQMLQNAIIRTDGWALRGAADGAGPGMDWVTAQTASIQLYNELISALNAI